MKTHPMLFSGPMVRAILAGHKTQTRRLLRRPSWAAPIVDAEQDADGVWGMPTNNGCWKALPIPQIGDLVWGRETWSDEHPLAIQEGRYSQEGRAGIPGPPGVRYRTIYKADGEPLQVWRNGTGEHPYFTLEGPSDEIAAKYPSVSSNYRNARGNGIIWTPSIHMPRWASRLTLTIVDVRLQRLQDINEADAIAEGCRPFFDEHDPQILKGPNGHEHEMMPLKGPIDDFRKLWDGLNEKRGPWSSNPMVGAFTFHAQRDNVDRIAA